MNMYIYICTQICACLNIQNCTQVRMHHILYINAYVYVYAYVNTRIYIYIYICMYMYIYIYVYIYIFIYLYLSTYLSFYLYIYLSNFILWIYMHIVHVVFGITLRSLKAFSSPTHKIIIPSPPFWPILPEDIPSLISMLPDTSFTATMPGCGSGCRAILGEIIGDPDPATRMITQVLKDTQPKSEHVWTFIKHARLLGFTSL